MLKQQTVPTSLGQLTVSSLTLGELRQLLGGGECQRGIDRDRSPTSRRCCPLARTCRLKGRRQRLRDIGAGFGTKDRLAGIKGALTFRDEADVCSSQQYRRAANGRGLDHCVSLLACRQD